MSETTGHNLQYCVEETVKTNGWVTYPEVSYIDCEELKQRDIDFVAIQKYPSLTPRATQVALVVECKYLKENVECYLRPNPREKGAYFIDGYPTEELFEHQPFHMFTVRQVALNIIKEKSAKDNLGSAIRQSIKALLYLRGSSRILDAKGLFYPLVVFGGPGKVLDQDGNELDAFLFYRRYEWKEPYSESKPVTRHMYVNIVSERLLEDYLTRIFKKEMEAVDNYIYDRPSDRFSQIVNNRRTTSYE